jgi:hypothetical protein
VSHVTRGPPTAAADGASGAAIRGVCWFGGTSRLSSGPQAPRFRGSHTEKTLVTIKKRSHLL